MTQPRPTLAILLAALLLLGALVIVAPSASAAPNGWDTLQQDIWRQAQPGGYSSAYTCGPCPSQGTVGTAVLQPGDYYFLVNGGCNSCGSASSTNAYAMTYNLFTVNWGASTSVSGVSSSITGMTVLESGGCSSSCYAYLGFTLTSTQTLSYSGYHPFGPGGQCGFGCSYGGGTISASALNGYGFMGAFWTGYSGAQNYHTVWFQAGLAPLSEAGILSTQMTRTPTTTQWSWTQIQGDRTLVSAAGSYSTVEFDDFAQSFAPDTTNYGAFVSITSFRLQPNSNGVACTSVTSITISKTLPAPWDTSVELANITATLSFNGAASLGPLFTIDWVNGLITNDDSSRVTITNVQLSVGGAPVTSTASFAPDLSGAPTAYLRVHANTPTCVASKGTSTSTYAGGDVWAYSAGAWTEKPARDFVDLTVKTYGKTVVLYSASQTQKDVGGASYIYICEVQKDSASQKYQLSTSYGGAARIGGYQAAGSGICSGVPNGAQQTIQEWRLGYESSINASQTVTLSLNTTGASRNLLYVGALIGTQPTHRHLAGTFSFTATGFNAVQTYKLLSTNDYYATLTVAVRACASVAADGSCSDAAAGKSGAPIPNGTYVGSVSQLRSFAGSWDANGTFNVSGQDVQGGAIALTIAAPGYVTDSGVVISVPSAPGNYTVNLTMLPAAQGTGLGVIQSSVRVTFNATNPQFASGQLIALSINRTLNVDLWVVLYELDQNGNPTAARGFAPYDWTPSQNNQLDVTWPDGRVLNDADTGAYVLSVFIRSTSTTEGVLVAYDSIGVNQAAVKVGTSLLTNLNVAGQNDIAAQQQVNAAVTSGAITEATVQQDFLTWLDWFPRTDFFVPNAVLYPALFMIGALLLRFGRQGGR